MGTKAETDPVSDDEWLIRLVWEDRVTDRVPLISPNAFEPRKGEVGGISLYRRACLSDPAEALLPIAAEKRDRYAIVSLPVALLRELGLDVTPDPRSDVPGHVVVPGINYTDYKADKARSTPIKLRLAEVSSANIIRRPIDPSSG